MNHHLTGILFRQAQCLHMFFKIGLPKDFAMFTGKHLCWSLFLPWLFLWNSSGCCFCSENVRKILRKAFVNQQNICKLTGFKLAASQELLSIIDVSQEIFWKLSKQSFLKRILDFWFYNLIFGNPKESFNKKQQSWVRLCPVKS